MSGPAAAPLAGTGRPAGPRQRRFRRAPRGLTLVVVVGLLAYFTFIFVLPVAQAFWYSLNNFDILTGSSRFVGLNNYARMLADPAFWNGLRVSFLFAGITIAVGFCLQLGLAATMTTFRGIPKAVLVTTFFVPAVLPNLAVIIVWKAMYRVDYGLLDVAALALGMHAIPWLTNGTLALLSIVILAAWKYLGYGAVIFMAGLNEIGHETFEAAELDGAGKIRQFFAISLPLLRPVLLVQMVASVITLLQFFDPFYALTNGGPSGSTQSIILYIYQESFMRLDFSGAAAITTALFLILLAISGIQLWLGRSHLTVEG